MGGSRKPKFILENGYGDHVLQNKNQYSWVKEDKGSWTGTVAKHLRTHMEAKSTLSVSRPGRNITRAPCSQKQEAGGKLTFLPPNPNTDVMDL